MNMQVTMKAVLTTSGLRVLHPLQNITSHHSCQNIDVLQWRHLANDSETSYMYAAAITL